MTESQKLANWVSGVSYEDMSDEARRQLKIRIIDSLGCAVGALDGPPVGRIAEHIREFDRSDLCSLIGGDKSAPDLAAFYNSALVRYLDFNDSYLAKGETCHPSDNLGAVLAAAEYSDLDGRDFMTALAVAYQVLCRLCDVAPVRDKGLDHTTLGSFGLAAGISKALKLDAEKTANAIGICGTAFNALRVTRTGELSNWKGLAYPNTAFCCTHGAFLAKRGITGPPEVFEGNKGFMHSISGTFKIDWSKEDLERVTKTIIKKFNAEIHSQSAIEAVLELKNEHGFTGADVDLVEIQIFDVAYHIIGGGEEGDKTVVKTKEEADHSLQYMVAAAILDGEVTPRQYSPERIVREDVQSLLKKVLVVPEKKYSGMFPDNHACRVTVRLKNGHSITVEKKDYEGFTTNPMSWETVTGKFEVLSRDYTDEALRNEIMGAVWDLENVKVRELTGLLSQVKSKRQSDK